MHLTVFVCQAMMPVSVIYSRGHCEFPCLGRVGLAVRNLMKYLVVVCAWSACVKEVQMFV